MSKDKLSSLEELAREREGFRQAPVTTRIQVGLERLEVHSSNLVVPWIEGSPQSLLNSLIRTNLFDLVAEDVAFVGAQIDPECEPRFVGVWTRFESLVYVLKSNHSVKHPEFAFVGMFIASVVLRNFFEVVALQKDLDNAKVEFNERRVSPIFVSHFVHKAKTLPFVFEYEGLVRQKIIELPPYLDRLIGIARGDSPRQPIAGCEQ